MTSNKSSSDILILENVAVNFGTVMGLENIHLRVKKGEIHAIVGSHGAGKSTLVNVISGIIPSTQGQIIFNNHLLAKHTPEHTFKLGINAVYQENSLVQEMTAVENIFLNREIRRWVFFKHVKKMREQTLKAFAELSIDINPDIPIKAYDFEQQQLIKLARIICFPSKLLIIDEISNKLSPKDLERLQFIISMLRQGGTTILYVCGDMDEIFNFANRVTVLNKGKIVETTDVSNIDKIRLVQLTYSSMYSREQLEKSNLKLFYLNNFHKSILNNIPFPMLVTDSKDIIVIMNKMFEELNNIHHTDFIGKAVREILDAKDIPLNNADYTGRAREMSQVKGISLKYCSTPHDLYILPFVDDDDAFMGTMYLLSHPSEHAELEKQIQHYQTGMDPQQRLAKVAHEINNPLGIMLNYLRLIKTATSPDLIHTNAEIIEKEIKRIKRILKQISEINEDALLSSGKTHVGDVIEEVAILLQPMMTGDNIHLEISGEKNIWLTVEPDLLKQVVLNIMLNGIEAMPDGGNLEIHVLTRTINEHLYSVIEITDNGIGIAKENREKIFEPFYTTKDTTESRGLGLSLCQDIISQLQGFIKVESTQQHGTTFQVFIPDVH
jgi:ABC-type branched-subunit amino acid transport system ATPase component/nitrogen-specific signal transduction histidine kinase